MSLNILSNIGDLSVADFLENYWQQKPLLIRNAFPEIPQLEAEEIAGFALEEDIESRLIQERSNGSWLLEHGPLPEDRFNDLPSSHWTLLVQAVDQLLPEMHSLLHQFRFIPNWRVDDIMVSYAVDQGSVGPHFDYYDVFLLQASGRRHWKIGQVCDENSALIKDCPLKILEHFHTRQEYTVEPGDLLYIPPQVAHWGVAQGACTTYSVGFRAPSYSDILLDLSQELASKTQAHQRYSDPKIKLRTNPGEISYEDLNRLKQALNTFLQDDSALTEWFGQYMTKAKRECPLTFEGDAPIQLAPNARAAYFEIEKQQAKLFINGEFWLCSLKLAQAVCAYESIQISEYDAEEQALINDWLGREFLI